MASTWGVNGTTATYKNDAGKVVATIKGLKSGLTASVVTSHIRVTEGEGGAAGTLTLDSSVLGTSKVTLTLSNGGKYALALDEVVDQVKIQNAKLSYASGKATVKGDLTAGYTLTNTKTITYSTAKTNQTLATVSNLNGALKTADDGTIYSPEESSESAAAEGEEGETATFTPVIQLGKDDKAGKILVTRDALTNKNATLKLDYAYSGYQLAFDGEAENFAPKIGGSGTWTYNNGKSTATYANTISTAGYALSLDGKTATYFAESETAKNLVTVSGVVKSDDGISIADETGNNNYPFKITLSNDALTSKNVSVSGAGYQLALADTGVLTEATATDTWSINKTTATYKRIYQPYYTYDATTNKVTYNAPTDIRTYATVSGVKSGLVVSSNGSALTSGEDTVISLDETNSNQINIYDGALNKAKVTLKNGTDSEGNDFTYKLALDGDVPVPTTSSETWKTNGTTATLTGKIDTAGYAQPDDNTITYAARATKAVTLATIKGLAKGIVAKSETSDSDVTVGANATVDGEKTFVSGLSKDGNTITLSKNILGTTNVALTSSAGFNYSLALNTSTEDTVVNADDTVAVVRTVPTTATDRTFWETTSSTVLLKDGKEAYYTETDKNTITYTAPVPDKTIATITGLSTKLKTNSDASEIDGITINPSNTKQLILSADALNKENIAITGSGRYTLAIDSKSTPQEVVGWEIENNVAYLKAYKSAGYTAASNGLTVTYSERVDDTSKTGLPEISGLKKGLAVKSDGSISGIVVGEWEDKVDATTGEPVTDDNGDTVQEFKAKASGKTIQISKSVLTTTDVNLSANSGYKFELASNVALSTPTEKWTVGTGKKAGTATYQVTTKAGYSLADDTTIKYSKKGTVTATISGLSTSLTANADNTQSPDGLEKDGNTIVVSEDAVGEKGKVTISGGNYTLALGEGMTAPEISPGHWEIKDNKAKTIGTATLYGVVDTEGYTLSADGKTITHVTKPESASTAASDDDDDDTDTEEAITLTTITGLKGGLVADKTGGVNGITGIKPNKTKAPTVFTLSKDVLGTSKVTITGGEYKLALDRNVLQEAEEAEEWVTSGTTATFKKYKQGYYTPDDTGSSIAYTAATKGTTYATVKGLASGVDVNDNFNSSTKTLILTQDKLGTTNVTLSGTAGYKLSLNSKVDTTAKNVEEWVTSGTTATFKNYSRGYYTLTNSNKITYTAATKGTTIATVKGIKSGVDVNDGYNASSKVLTLSNAMLNEAKVTISGDGYTLALGGDVTQAKSGESNWKTTLKNKLVTATYDQTISAGYAVPSGGKSITYSASATTKTLATIKGLAESVHLPAVEVEGDPNYGKNIASEISGITVNESKTIIFDSSDLIASGKTATLTSTDYTLAVNDDVASKEDGTPAWTINKSKGTATYAVDMKAGLDLASDAKSIKNTDAYSKPILTVSGLNTTALNTLTLEDGKTSTLPGFSVDRYENVVELSKAAEPFITKKATLGKNDGYTFAFNGITEPTEYSSPKWFVSTVKSTTTAALKDGIEAGYTLSEDEKSVSLTAEQVGDAKFTITGLKKGLAVSSDRQTIGVKEKTGKINNGITVTGSKIALDSAVFGTSTVALEGSGYSFSSVSGIAPGTEKPTWTLKNGTATYANKQSAGFTLSGDSKTFTYTKASSTTLATVTGLNKNYTGVDLNNSAAPISVDTQNKITIGKDLVGTSKITVTVPKNSAAYTLALAKEVPEQANEKTGWVTSGANASYKDYTDSYYTVAANGKSITYNKAKDVKVYATVKGIRSGATITDTDKVITLSEAQLTTKDVSLTAGANLGYVLKLADGVPTEVATEDSTEWVTSGTTATYKTYKKGAYSINTKGVVVYTKGTAGTGHATIKGATADISAASVESGGTFDISGDELAEKVTVMGGGGEDGYAFNFTNYNNASITGSAKEDTFNSNGTGLWISTADGADSVEVSGSSVTVISGAGNDTVTATGANAILNLGAGADSVYVTGQESSISGGAGNDYIVVTGADSSVLAGAGDDTVSSSGTNAVLDLGAGNDVVEVISGDNSSISGGAGNDSIVVMGTGISVLAGAGDDTIESSGDGGNEFFFAKDQGNDLIKGFQANDVIQVTSGTAKAALVGSNIVVTIGKGKVTVEGGTESGTININGTEVTPVPDTSSNILLADDNYSTDAAQLSSIVQPFATTYTPYDFDSGLRLTKEDYTPEISYANDDK